MINKLYVTDVVVYIHKIIPALPKEGWDITRIVDSYYDHLVEDGVYERSIELIR